MWYVYYPVQLHITNLSLHCAVLGVSIVHVTKCSVITVIASFPKYNRYDVPITPWKDAISLHNSENLNKRVKHLANINVGKE